MVAINDSKLKINTISPEPKPIIKVVIPQHLHLTRKSKQEKEQLKYLS